MIWREILLPSFSHPGDEGDDPQMGNPLRNLCRTTFGDHCQQILHFQGLFPSDVALESKIFEFFAQRTASALSYASHFTDDMDPSFLALEPDSHAAPTAKPSIRKVNAWQFLNLPELWTPRRIGKKRKLPKKGADMHLFWNSSTPHELLAGEAGLDYDPVSLHGWGSRIDLQCGSH